VLSSKVIFYFEICCNVLGIGGRLIRTISLLNQSRVYLKEKRVTGLFSIKKNQHLIDSWIILCWTKLIRLFQFLIFCASANSKHFHSCEASWWKVKRWPSQGFCRSLYKKFAYKSLIVRPKGSQSIHFQFSSSFFQSPTSSNNFWATLVLYSVVF